MAEGYSLKSYFGGKETEGYRKYKEGQKSGKWIDLPDYIAKGGSSSAVPGGGLSSAVPGSMFKQQEARESDFLSRFRTTLGQQTPIGDIYTRLSTEAGLPEARKLTGGLTQSALDVQGRLAGLPERIAGETRGFDVNATQLARIQETRAQPVAKQLSETALAAERAGVSERALAGDVSTRLGLEVSEQQKQLQPFQVEASMISDRAARELTGYTTQLQAQTGQLIAKLLQQGTLDQIEARRLVDLASQEDSFQKQKQLLAYQKSLSTGGTNYTPILTSLDESMGISYPIGFIGPKP